MDGRHKPVHLIPDGLSAHTTPAVCEYIASTHGKMRQQFQLSARRALSLTTWPGIM
jgi:hypothetical protein